MNATVTNQHHFCEDITLTIQNDKLTWRCNDVVVDPKNSLGDFIALIDLIFRFTGTLTNGCYTKKITNELQIDSDQNLTTWDIVNRIYETPLEHNIKFVRIATCGCNMGHCDAIVGIEIDNKDYKTYGEVMTLFGYEVITKEGHIYYEYPDSVILSLERIVNLPREIHSRWTCHSVKKSVSDTLDPNKIYLSYSYGR